ncbi:MAG: SDR family NAD(P)-dependent oxidoreductase [Gammaproteobacteria bacterium]|nr:SDR family NAD(P)-dependent oxidoreductase [Gammaproteobacteria bacterium]
MKNVEDKVAFITGGASGIGRAMARSFAGAGMKVVVCDIEESALEDFREEFKGSNAEVLAIQADVTDRDSMEAAANAAEERFGKVHVLCNNAGVAVTGPVDTMSYKDWDWVLDVNLNGVVNGIVTFLDRIKAHGEGGHIVNTSSMAGQVGIRGMSVYNASKFAVLGMSESMALELSEHNIGVSALCPGLVNTNIFTSERNRPDEFGGPEASGELIPNPDDESDRSLDELLRTSLDPSAVGDMVLHAIQNDEFYIFTHPEFISLLEGRGEMLRTSFDRWSEYVKNRSS